jgi:hypothetical protein
MAGVETRVSIETVSTKVEARHPHPQIPEKVWAAFGTIGRAT